MRQRHCRPVVVVSACPAPAWEECFDPCGAGGPAVVDSIPPEPACCGDLVVTGPVDDASLGGGEVAATETMETIAKAAEPTPAVEPAPPAVAATEQRPPSLEPIAPPPALEPASDAVTPASNEQPMPESPAAAPERSVVVDPEHREAEPPVEAPVMPKEAEEAEEAEPAVPAPQPPVAEPVVSPPEPEAGNIFEELDAADSADESEMTEDADDPFGEPADDEPALDEDGDPALDEEMAEDEPADEPSLADPVEEEPAAASEEPADEDEAEMPEEDASPVDDEPADPFAEDDAAEPAGEESDDAPAAGEPAAADPFAASEPLRRWIDATGTAALVATLVDVAADGSCMLETRGRRIVVPVANLSRHDQDYVRRAGIRLAKIRGEEAGETVAAPLPAPTDTAGL